MCSRQYCPGVLGYSDKECSMHVFMPVLSWDGQSISGLMTWDGTTHIPLKFYAI